ncbi:MAG TPA: histidine kinase dimerization/phosphoacceptor domain -containing protein [Caulobacteraceae bacterium]|jgi:two-component sensor histidine kinase|nr:histidine kinase dimerization/phosphoacceptor domain -containing protein [Caulobacteraceae bacterium]
MAKASAEAGAASGELECLRVYSQIVADLSRLAATDPDLTEFLRQVVHQVARAVDIDRIKILRYRPDHGDLLVESGVGWKEGVVGKATLSVGLTSPPGRSIQIGKVIAIENLPASTEYRRSGLLADHDIVSLINAPVTAEGHCWGVLEADSREPRRFSLDTERFMETVANLVGAMVQRKEFEGRVVEAHAEAARELARREVLLREMQHRVKNNFQLIVSLLLLQSNRAEQDGEKKALQSVADRITAIALAHDQLDPRQGLRTVDVSTYLGAICREMADLSDDVAIEADLEPAVMTIDTAVPLGLITNELITNALKHAFDGPGNIRVEFRAGAGIRESTLAVIDDGKGMGPERPGSFGTSLIEALAAQVRGRVDLERPGRGTAVRLFFPPSD